MKIGPCSKLICLRQRSSVGYEHSRVTSSRQSHSVKSLYPIVGWLIEGWQWEVPKAHLVSSPIIERQTGVTLLGKLIHYFREFIVKFLSVENDTNHLMKKSNYPFNIIRRGSPWAFWGQTSLTVFLSSLLACF